MSKNILVTGGAGYIGSHTVVELVAAGFNPIILDNFSNSETFIIERLQKLTGRKLTVYSLDFAKKTKVRELLDKEAIEGVVHFAAFKQVGESVVNPLKYFNNNVAGLINFLEVIEQSSRVKTFVFSSSCTVYGEPDKLPVTEQSPIKAAASPYGATKQLGEVIARETTIASKKLSSVALRYFNPIGAHQTSLIGELPKGIPANLVPFITQTAAGLRDVLTVFGDDYPTKDGSCIRDYIHVVDLAKAHVKALDYLFDQAAGSYDYFNIGTGRGYSVLEAIEAFETATKVKLNYKIGPRREGDIISTYADATKANRVLKWKAEKSLTEALADAWRWQQSLT